MRSFHKFFLPTLVLTVIVAGCSSATVAPDAAPAPGQIAAPTEPEPVQNSIEKPRYESSFIAGEKVKLYAAADEKAKVIFTLEAGSMVREIGFQDDWLQLMHNKADGTFIIGWAHKRFFVKGYETLEYETMKLEASIVGFSDEMKSLIRDHRIKAGMTEQMVVLSWGVPDKKLVVQTGTERSQKWIYENVHLIFKSGRLDRWIVY